MTRIAGYFFDGRCDVAIYDGGNSIAPFAPYRAPGEARASVEQSRPLPAAGWVRDMAAPCTPFRYAAMTSEKREDDIEEWQTEQRNRRTARATPAAVDREQPIFVTDWPTRPVEVEPEPVPVIVNRTAARFGALEIRRGGE